MKTKEIIVALQNTNNIYKRNMDALKKKNISLYNKIMSLPEQTDYILYREKINDVQNLISMSRQLTYYEVDNSVECVEKEIEQLKLKNARIAVFLGIGLGYEIIYFVNDLMKKNKTMTILVIEKDLQLFKKALESTLLVDLIEKEKIMFMVGEEIQEDMFLKLHKFFDNSENLLFLKCVNFVYSNGMFRFDKDYYMEVINVIKEAIRYTVINYGNDMEDGLIGYQNILENIDYIANNPGINLLFNKFKNKPAIVIATGPSLDKSLKYLKGLEDKALLLAPDNSLNILKKNGINPHIITSLERVNATVEFFKGYTKEDVKDIYLAATPVVMNGVYENYPGPNLIVYRKFNHFKWIGIDKGILQVQRSAGNMCFNIAEVLGCNPIILVGQDLSYSATGETHASGALYGKNIIDKIEKNENDDYIKVKGNYTEWVYTSKAMYDFLKDYEYDIKNYKGLCINATEGGAFIAGAKLMHLQEAVKKYVKDDFYPLEVIKKNILSFDTKKIEKDLDNLEIIMEKTFEELDEMKKIIDEMEKFAEQNVEYIYNLYDKQDFTDVEKEDIHRCYIQMFNYHTKYKDKKTFEDVMLHITQSYEINFIMNLNAIDCYDEDEEHLEIRKFLEFREWLFVYKEMTVKVEQTIEEKNDHNCFEKWNLETFDINFI